MTILRNLTFDDVLLVPNYSPVKSRDDVSLATTLGPFEFKIPIISANMDSITGPSMASTIGQLGGLGILHRFNTPVEGMQDFNHVENVFGIDVGVSVGVGDEGKDRFVALYQAGARLFCLDIAHAHSKVAGDMVEWIKKTKGVFLIAGNVATREGAEYLATKGADVVKVGIGAGSVCTTREQTGFGVPQLSAIMDCAPIGIPIIADGGMRKPADVVKALAAGASMVMLGGMLAGTDEAAIPELYRGSSTLKERYTEGVSKQALLKGPVASVINEVCDGIRSGCSYAGARNIRELQHRSRFIEVSHSVAVEGTPHGLG